MGYEASPAYETVGTAPFGSGYESVITKAPRDDRGAKRNPAYQPRVDGKGFLPAERPHYDSLDHSGARVPAGYDSFDYATEEDSTPGYQVPGDWMTKSSV